MWNIEKLHGFGYIIYMNYYFDTEFIDDGKNIELVSIGMVDDFCHEFYAESSEFDANKANDWVKRNVLSKLGTDRKPLNQIGRELLQFVYGNLPSGETIRLYGWFSAWDFILLARLVSETGQLLDTPRGFPQRCNDLAQSFEERGPFVRPPSDPNQAHNSLYDAKWTKQMYETIYRRN